MARSLASASRWNGQAPIKRHNISATCLPDFAPGFNVAQGLGVAFVGFLVGYFLHLVADSLTIGGVPWLWPSHARFGFPPNHKWRFKSGTWVEKVVVVVVSLVVIGWCVYRWRQGYPVI